MGTAEDTRYKIQDARYKIQDGFDGGSDV